MIYNFIYCFFINQINFIKLIVLNKIDLIDEETVNEVIDHFSKGKNCEIMTMTTLEKESVSKIKAKLLSYVS